MDVFMSAFTLFQIGLGLFYNRYCSKVKSLINSSIIYLYYTSKRLSTVSIYLTCNSIFLTRS